MLKKSGDRGLPRIGLFALQVTAGISLRIKVNDQGAQTLAGADGSQVAGDGGFPDATLLIEDDEWHGDDPGCGTRKLNA
jgi:hypothetical protein